MSGVVKSVGGFLGTSSGPGGGPAGNFGNGGLDALNGQLAGATSDYGQDAINQATSSGDVQAQLNNLGASGLSTNQQQGLGNQLATGATTGSDYATQQVEGNGLEMQGLNNMQNSYNQGEGQLATGQQTQAGQQGILNGLQSQGFNLQPQDQTLYGQEAGGIANQYAQQGNQAANSLASRGLSSSGAAGAQFSGIAGNQNQQLAQAQQQIAQQRYQNTQQQIGQQQQFIGQLNGQNNQMSGSLGSLAGQQASTAANDVSQQYNRQLSGAQASQGLAGNVSGQQQSQNNASNTYGMGLFNNTVSNTPSNIGDLFSAGTTGVLGSAGGAFGKGAGQASASSLFGSGAAPAAAAAGG